jgi:hypothetical protein
MRIILDQCERSRTVRRVIHTGSVTAASPLREDGSGGYKDFINESCWSPPNLTCDFTNDYLNVRNRSINIINQLDHSHGDTNFLMDFA